MTKVFKKNNFTQNQITATLALPSELDDFKQILIQAAESKKYDPNNWLLQDGKKQDIKSQYDSIMHHILAYMRGEKVDKDSKLDHRLHAACRLMMDYTRSKRGMVHPIDVPLFEDDSYKVVDYLNKSGNEQSGVSYLADDYGIWGNKFYGRD